MQEITGEVVSEILNSSTIAGGILTELGDIGKSLETLGLIAFFWIVFALINLIVNRINRKSISIIKDDVERIEKKIDLILKKKS